MSGYHGLEKGAGEGIIIKGSTKEFLCGDRSFVS